MAADIDLGDSQTKLGVSGHPYCGEFNGNGHVLTVHYNETSGGYAAPFAYLGNKATTISNLQVTGTIFTTAKFAGGFIGEVMKDVTIKNSRSSVAITCKVEGDASAGGFVGRGRAGVITLTDCLFDGEFHDSEAVGFGGLVGWSETAPVVTNCLVSPTELDIDPSYKLCMTFVRSRNSATITNSYFTTSMNGTATDFPAVVSLENAADNSSTISGNTGSGKNVLLNDRILYSDGNWNTLCLPFSIPAGASGYSPIAGAEVKELENSSITEGKLTINFTDATSMEAGKPYLVKWNNLIEGNLPNPVFTNVTICEGTTIAKTLYINFIGCFSPKALAADDRTVLYLGAANKLYYPNEAMNINACGAYFSMKAFRADNPTTSPTLSSSMMTMPEGEQQ